MKTNILITSAGRRVSLVKAFQHELKSHFQKANVFTTDMKPEWSSACRISDGFFTLPRVTDSEYVNVLYDLCIEYSVGLVIPTIDTELLVLATNKQKFADAGIVLAVSDFELVVRCRDKRNTNQLFEEFGIQFPKPIDKNNPVFPVFIKPYDGSLSKDILLIRDQMAWNESFLENEKLMFMEYLNPEDYQEFTVDAYFDKSGILKGLVPRRRIEVRGGEISKGRTEKGALYETLVSKFREMKGARSCLTMQFFEHKTSGRVVGIEINPRFGGGFPLSYEAKANYPDMLIREYLLNEPLDFLDNWIDGLVMLRYDAEIIVKSDAFAE
jgi:carbamoyl-phosphate synthase large subunit